MPQSLKTSCLTPNITLLIFLKKKKKIYFIPREEHKERNEHTRPRPEWFQPCRDCSGDEGCLWRPQRHSRDRQVGEKKEHSDSRDQQEWTSLRNILTGEQTRY